METLPQPTDSHLEAVSFPLAAPLPRSYVPLPQNFCHERENAGLFDAPPTGALTWNPAEADRAGRSTARARSAPDSPWVADFDWAYRRAMARHLRTWSTRPGEYAAARARAIAFDPWERMATCETRERVVTCGCERRWVRIKVGCGQRWLCPKCQKSFYSRYGKKLKRAMKARQRLARATYISRGKRKGERRDWTLVTLTVRHSGSIARDRETLVRGWKRLRQWLWSRIGKFDFALVWEFTKGRDERGHLHAHVAALWPWFDWADLAVAWKRATGGESTRINCQRATKGAGGAAAYLAKYVSKGLEVTDAPAVLAAEAVATMYGKRHVTASHKFWKPARKTCTTCLQPWQLVVTPRGLAQTAPWACWRANGWRIGVESRRGPPQKEFATGGGWARRSPGQSKASG